MIGVLKNTAIKGICSVVPEHVVENAQCRDILSERELKKQIKMTGIRNRHMVKGLQTSSSLCTLAAKELLGKLDWKPDTIKVLIYASQTPDVDRPSTAFIIHKNLKLSRDCIVFDVNLGCSAYVEGCIIMSSILNTCGGKGLLLVGDGDPMLERSGKGETLLMGDAGTATAFEFEAGAKDIPYSFYSDGTGYKVIMKKKNEPVKMNAPAVFSFAINDVSESITTYMQDNGVMDKDIDYYVLHQAQKMIIENIADVCNLPHEKLLSSLEEYGNTVGASIPVTLCANKNLYQKKSLSLLLVGYGIGLAWGCIHVHVPSNGIMNIIMSDEVIGEMDENAGSCN